MIVYLIIFGNKYTTTIEFRISRDNSKTTFHETSSFDGLLHFSICFTIRPRTAPCALPVSSACELEVSFARPTAIATLAVKVAGGSFQLDYVPNSTTVNVSFANNTGQAVIGAASRSGGGVSFPIDELTILPTDNMITMRIFLDADLAEVCASAPADRLWIMDKRDPMPYCFVAQTLWGAGWQ